MTIVSRKMLIGLLAAALALVGSLPTATAQTSPPAKTSSPAKTGTTQTDQHMNYYYPPPQTREVYRSPAATLPESGRERRLGFVTGMTQQMLSNPYPPPFAMFAKGDKAEKLIIVSLTDDGYNTLYRARALFAMLTAVARLTPFFRENAVDEIFNFFDLCKLLGFTQITWTDGRRLAHQVTLK